MDANSHRNRSEFGGYIRGLLQVSPQDVIADSRDAGINVSIVEDFRNQTPDQRIETDRLAERYITETTKWCAITGTTAGIGGLLTAATLGFADLVHVVARLYRLSLRLAVLHGLDPEIPGHRERIEEIYISALGFDPNRQAIVGRALGRPAEGWGESVYPFRLVLSLAKQLWGRLMSRMAGRFFPLIGGMAGAWANYHLANKASRYMKEMFGRELADQQYRHQDLN
jgi:hypothetical protein